jgi:L-aspartate oxidase
MDNFLKTDVLVIGSGLSGLLSTLRLLEAGASVVLACKGPLLESNTSYAQGGIAASLNFSSVDSPALHLEDTVRAGGGLVNRLVARQIIFEAPLLISELQRHGVEFDMDKSGQLSLAREGGHSQSRIVHSEDTTGISVTSKLVNRIKTLGQSVGLAGQPSLQILENAFATTLLMNDSICCGASFEMDGNSVKILAGQTILATGGLGQLFARTTNPSIATGDGIALAFRAGAKLVDMEFVQFHPTALSLNKAPAFLISEAVRGAGAKLLDCRGQAFMDKFHQDGELATRDIVSRAIHTIMQSENSNNVSLDLRPIGQEVLSSRFPNIVNTLRKFGIDSFSEPVPVSPAAHYFMGGIMTDPFGRTSINGLYAVGECASVGLHGANRLASNSLLEGGVMALRAASAITAKSSSQVNATVATKKSRPSLLLDIPDDVDKLKQIMYAKVGLIRTQKSLESALNRMSRNVTTRLSDRKQSIEHANLQLVANLVTRSALMRNESRGAHFREDFPLANDLIFKRRLLISQQGYDWLSVDNMQESAVSGTARPLLNVSA